MEFDRSSGILLHPTSLPGPYGIGDLGKGSFQFVDFLVEGGQQLWQILPLGPTGFGDSPYQCFSAFAGNPLLIDFNNLVETGLLPAEALDDSPVFSAGNIEYGSVIEFKWRILNKAVKIFQSQKSADQTLKFNEFCENNKDWLDDYALFIALKSHNHGQTWSSWDPDLVKRKPEALKKAREDLRSEIEGQKFLQWVFFQQWYTLKKYAGEKGIKIIGDLPIFVAFDSADVWSNPDLFYLDENGRPTVVAGVPPDYFSETGQLWGNPLYRWEVIASTGYNWWIRRLKMVFSQVDLVRLDHFRGFEAYWAVPGSDSTAENGKWQKGPGNAFFSAVRAAFDKLPIIAEDLGQISKGVTNLRDEFKFPGMKVLQFAFGSGPHNPYLPHNYSRNEVVYTGTHDNDTTLGWFNKAGEEEKTEVLRYVGSSSGNISWDLIRLAFQSVADLAIVPLQDLLGLGTEARMNFPGKASGNWGWRFQEEDLTPELARRLYELTEAYGRTYCEPLPESEDDDLMIDFAVKKPKKF